MTSRPVTLACAYALAGWAFFTALLAGLGNVLLPSLSRPAAPLVVAGLSALTAAAVALLSLDYFRRAGHADVHAGLVLGICLAAVGLTLDGLLLLSTRFRYPNVAEQRTATLAVLLLLGYAVAAVVPPAVASLGARSRRRASHG